MFTDDELNAGEALLEVTASEIYLRLVKFYATRTGPAERIAAGLGTLMVAAGACKATGIDRDRFVAMAGLIWDKTVVISPEQALDMMAGRVREKC